MFTDKAELANRSPPNLPENIAKIVVLFTCGFTCQYNVVSVINCNLLYGCFTIHHVHVA